MTIIQRGSQAVEQVQTIQLIEVGPRQAVPAPFLRITTCGLLTVEVIEEVTSTDPPLARYRSFAPEQLRGRGTAPALMLLKLFLSRPERFGLRDWLIDQFCRDRELFASVRLDNIASQLRSLLCPREYEDLRKHLVTHVRGNSSSGDGYQLASYPLIWIDRDALAWNIEQAVRMERFGENALPYWERAYELAKRGAYLPDEIYSDWASARRGEVEGMLRQSVQALARLYLAHHGGAGEEEALLLLRSYWQEHQRAEDILRALMELLGRRECYQQGLDYYQQLCALLKEEGHQPDVHTQDVAAYLQAKQIQRSPVENHHAPLSQPTVPLIVPGTIEISLEEEDVEDNVPLLPSAEAAQHPFLAETRHLIGREAWLDTIRCLVQGTPAKKLLVLHGPVGVGKSSELARLATLFLEAEQAPARVIWSALPTAEWDGNPETALDVFLGTVFSACGIAALPAETPRARRLDAFFQFLDRESHRLILLLDNAECLLAENGHLAPCWEAVLTRFVRSRHSATMLLATKEWRGWPGREGVFVAETVVPPLTQQECVTLLHHLGLDAVPDEHLYTLSERLAGIPLLLEWAAKLSHDPLLFDDWRSFDEDEEASHPGQENLTRRLVRLLEDPTLLGTHLATRLAPLLQRIIDQHLSSEARQVLERLAVVTIPLGKPALQILCPRPALLKELRDASLLAAYTHRVQLLPVVASTVCQQMTPEQRQEAEELAIQAYTRWLEDGNVEMHETGSVAAELATVLLMHQQLQHVTLVLLYHGWLSFNAGFGARLASLAKKVLLSAHWHSTVEEECAGLLIMRTLFPFLGQPVEAREHVDYQRLTETFHHKQIKIALPLEIEDAVLHKLLVDATNTLHFAEAQDLLDAYCSRLRLRLIAQPEQYPTLLQDQALLYKKWGKYLEEQGEKDQARIIREQTILFHRQQIQLLTSQKKGVSVHENQRKRGLASHFNDLGYNLNRMGHYEEALQVIEQAITLHEQGYGYLGILAASYGEKSQILMELGRFQEALLFDEKAVAEICRCAEAGDGLSQEELWIYHVNRGRLYLRLGRTEEAEKILQEALPHIHSRRSVYRMFAKEALREIAEARQHSRSPQPQLDWRWVERFRELESYDSYWWLTWAGPFTEEEQRQWNEVFALPFDEATKAQLGKFMKISRERELAGAIAEQREPHLQYPAIEIDEVRRRITAQRQLDADIQQQEPNAIVRRLYHEVIEEELDYLSLIEATYEGDTQKFWQQCQRLDPLPTREEMIEALASVKWTLRRGLATPRAAHIAQQFQGFLRTRLQIPLDLLLDKEGGRDADAQHSVEHASHSDQHLSAQGAKRFFEAVLQTSGYDGWQVVIDPNAANARVEKGARTIFLEERRFWLHEIKHLFIHELVGHVARCVAGERSPLGLLGLGTKNAEPIQEGIALYDEKQILAKRGQHENATTRQLSVVALGLACGVLTPPQTFLSVYRFYEFQTLLHYLISYPDFEEQAAHKQAQSYALARCLRKYRGVPDLTQPGVCYLQDLVYHHGLHLIEQAVTKDETILDRLSIGVCKIEDLPDLQELGITASPQPLRKLAYADDLDEYILSFEEHTQ